MMFPWESACCTDTLAAVSIFRDLDSLREELTMKPAIWHGDGVQGRPGCAIP